MSNRLPPRYDWRLLRQQGIEDSIIHAGYKKPKVNLSQKVANGVGSVVLILGYAIVLIPVVAFSAAIIGGLGIPFFILFTLWVYGRHAS